MPTPVTALITVDCIAFSDKSVLLIKRKNPPFRGCFALPGGFVDVGETVEHACRREFNEETGLQAGVLELVGVYSSPDRDPRGHTVSVAFATELTRDPPTAGDDAAAANWIVDWQNQELAFDHALIIADAARKMGWE